MLNKLLENGELYDYVFTLNGKQYKIQDHIINPILQYFKGFRNNKYKDSNNLTINIKPLDDSITDKDIINIFNNILTSIYKNQNIIVSNVDNYKSSYCKFVEFFRLLSYFCYDYNKDDFFEYFGKLYVGDNNLTFVDSNLCFYNIHQERRASKEHIFDTQTWSHSDLDCILYKKYSTGRSIWGGRNWCYHYNSDNPYNTKTACQCKTKINMEVEPLKYARLINPQINTTYGTYLLTIYKNNPKIITILPNIIITPQNIQLYNRITEGKYLSQLLTNYVYSHIKKLMDESTYYKNVKWDQQIDYDMNTIKSGVIDLSNTDLYTEVKIYDYYNDGHIYINNYDILVSTTIMKKSCNKFTNNSMVILTDRNPDMFIEYIKYIYYGVLDENINDINKIEDIMYFYKYMDTNKIIIDLTAIITRYGMLCIKHFEGLTLYEMLDYYYNNLYIAAYIENYITVQVKKLIGDIKYGNYEMSDKFLNKDKKCERFTWTGRKSNDTIDVLSENEHCECNTAFYNKSIKSLLVDCNVDDKMNCVYMYMLGYLVRDDRYMVLSCLTRGKFNIEDIEKFPVEYQPFVANVILRNKV